MHLWTPGPPGKYPWETTGSTSRNGTASGAWRIRDHGEVKLESKAGQDLERYFPEVAEALTTIKATRFVLDGELLLIQDGRANFDLLLQRIHPAASRVQKLSRETPAVFVLFDVLVDEHGYSLVEKPLKERRHILEDFFQKSLTEVKALCSRRTHMALIRQRNGSPNSEARSMGSLRRG